MLTEKFYGLDAATLNAILTLNPTTHAAAKTPIPAYSNQLTNGTAVINVFGVLFPRANFLTLYGYGTALTAIKASLDEAITDPLVSKIVLNFDSPGGAVAGINDLAAYIKTITKPVNAVVVGQCCSAAYWLASACDQITCESTSVLGSIGIVGVFQKYGPDTIEIVSSNAPNKRPDPFTDAGKAVLLQTLDDLEKEFIGALVKLRSGKLSEQSIKAMQGGVFIGNKACQNGLADGLGSLSGALLGVAPSQPIAGESASSSDNYDWERAFAKVVPQQMAIESNQSIATSANNSDSSDNYGWDKAFEKAMGN